MPKKILVIVSSFEIGGTIVSLHSLLKAIDPSRIAVDVFAIRKDGAFLNKMENCRILDENCWLSESYSQAAGFKKARIILVKLLKIVCRKLHTDITSFCIKHGCKQLGTEQYDAIVSYQENITREISKYPAKKRIAWIHSDYSRFLELRGVKDEKEVYANINKTVCVSVYAKSVFDAIYPQFSGKSVAIHNVIDVENIRSKATENNDLDPLFDTSFFTIVSAGRLDPVKQFEKIPHIAKQIKGITRVQFKWYIIGGSRGFDDVEKTLRMRIKEYGLQDCVIRLSEKQNIYPYIAKANLYVCTSLSESFPLVVNEAKALCVPVVSNSFPSVRESIREGIDGYVVTMENMASKIVEVMNYGLKIETTSIENQSILNKIYVLFEN